jgi:hypothetical protein
VAKRESEHLKNLSLMATWEGPDLAEVVIMTKQEEYWEDV